MNLAKLSEELWRLFFSKESAQHIDKVTEWCTPECVIIGTGEQEFYTNLDGFLYSFADEMRDRNDVEFDFKNINCTEIRLGSDVCYVYGKFHVVGENKDKTVPIHINRRFTFIFRKFEDKWKIVHLHQSVADPEQGANEYYSKTLMNRIHELQCVNKEMTVLAKKDCLTCLDNFRSFCNNWEEMENKHGWFFILDLDHFKQVNDTYGHLKGNEVLIGMGKVFYSTVRENDLLCRMGGDEFFIFSNGMKDKVAATEFADRLTCELKKFGESVSCWTTVSIGSTEVTPEMSLDSAIEKADKALYTAKKIKKGSFYAM